MPTRHPLTVSLTPELARLVANEVSSGHYTSASEVIRAGLRLLVTGNGPSVSAAANLLVHDAEPGANGRSPSHG